MEKRLFGKLPGGRPVYAYIMKKGRMEAEIIEMGGIIRRLLVDGTDVILGFDTLEDVMKDNSNQGSLIGRYGNRIAGARINVGGTEYRLYPNNGKNTLHGGRSGYNRKMWYAEPVSDTVLKLSYFSADGEENFPGNLDVSVTYTLYDNAIGIRYEAVSDKDTFVNLTNHSYFNLDGVESRTILEHTLQINADTYTAVDSELIPTGREPVENTRFDFRTPKKIGRDLTGETIADSDFGYDHNFNLNGYPREVYDGENLAVAAVLSNGKISMKTLTDQPGVQVYTSNFLSGETPFKGGVPQNRRKAICLETQFEPDAPSRGENLLKAGQKYETVTVYKFD